jgi:hypothetical protein
MTCTQVDLMDVNLSIEGDRQQGRVVPGDLDVFYCLLLIEILLSEIEFEWQSL